jgi:hypothetical protein
VRKTSRSASVDGAYELLRAHASRHPHVVIHDELRQIMSWALVLPDSGELQASPSLQKLVKVIQAELAVSKAKRAAQHLAATFQAAKAAGTKQLDQCKTIEEVVQRLGTGVNGSGSAKDKRFFSQSTPELTAEALRHLKYEAKNQSLRYVPAEVDLKVSRVPLEGIAELAMLIEPRSLAAQNTQAHTAESTSQATPSSPSAAVNSWVSEEDALSTAQRLVSVYSIAESVGSKDIPKLQSLDEVIERLTTDGLAGAGVLEGKRIYTRTKPGEAVAARAYLQYDSFTKTLRYASGGTASRPTAPARTEARPNVINVGREIRQSSTSAVSAAQAEKKAMDLVVNFEMATAGGKSNFADANTLEDVIQRLNVGVMATGPFSGRRFSSNCTPAEALAVKAYLKYDAASKTLRFTPPTTPSTPRGQPTAQDMAESRVAMNEARDRRTAQTFASTFNAAVAAGSKELANVRTLDQALQSIIAGVKGDGAFKDRLFVLNATSEDAAKAKPYLEFHPDDQSLRYKSSPR